MSPPEPGRYETRIGLELHVQLRTRTKMFCGCRVEFGAPPNTRVCPVCLGLPGALPRLNRRAVELAILAATGLGCRVNRRSVFARKNYFYPDLPKGYQITQYDRPLAVGGVLVIQNGSRGSDARIGLRRLHLEEDSGKSVHDRYPGRTAVDLNRAGTPLVEIVTEPSLCSPAQARSFASRLKQLLQYLEVSDCNMEEGSLRVDANVSIRLRGSRQLATNTEIKNMNSFSQMEKALTYEATRQLEIVESGGRVGRETLLWDARRGEVRPMRGKEEVSDYRYFPEPDLPTLVISEATVDSLRRQLPELPWDRHERFVTEYGLPDYDASVLTSERGRADYFEDLARRAPDPKLASNWLMGEVLALCNERGVGLNELGVSPERLGELVSLVADGTLSDNLGKRTLREMIRTGKTAPQIVEQERLHTVTDTERIRAWVSAVLEEKAAEVRRYREGEQRLLGYFIGEVMRKSDGRADPALARELLLRALAEAPDD